MYTIKSRQFNTPAARSIAVSTSCTHGCPDPLPSQPAAHMYTVKSRQFNTSAARSIAVSAAHMYTVKSRQFNTSAARSIAVSTSCTHVHRQITPVQQIGCPIHCRLNQLHTCTPSNLTSSTHRLPDPLPSQPAAHMYTVKSHQFNTLAAQSIAVSKTIKISTSCVVRHNKPRPLLPPSE